MYIYTWINNYTAAAATAAATATATTTTTTTTTILLVVHWPYETYSSQHYYLSYK